MRRLLLGLVVALALSAGGSQAHAQLFGGINDPALAYYALYLPRQQVQALTPGPEATLNAVSANRQQYAATNRNGMFDPNGAGFDALDFGTDFSTGSARRKRTAVTNGGRYGVHGGNLNGLGPQGYYSPVTLNRYYRDLRSGRGKNANLAVTKRGGGISAGYAGVGGLPGPR